MHQSSYQKMALFRERYLAGREQEKLVVADLGSYDVNGSYRPLFAESAWRYLGLDVSPGPNVDIVMRNPYRWPELPSDVADVVISGQALEHIEFFWLTMLEISRILKPGGLCCLIAPSAGPEHRFPVDCWRFYRDGMAALGKWAGFEILASETADAVAENTFSDDSELWRDSMLVARQPAKTLARRWREWRRRQSLKMVAVASADRE
jgi:SAM-dependent methyltransferase